MKTKLEIFFYRTGITNTIMAKVISAHNEGLNLLLIQEVNAILKGLRTEYPSNLKDLKLEFIERDGKLNVYEDGKTITSTIQETEFYTLVDAEAGEDAIFLHLKSN